MGCLALSKAFFLECAEPELKRCFPELSGRIAAGLVGNGSECFGYDDELSKDHDWGIDFYLWVTEKDRCQIPLLSEWKRDLLSHLPMDMQRTRSAYGAQINVSTVGDFYCRLIGKPDGPHTIGEWRAIPQENLAMAVNGEVFQDPTGDFSRVRARLVEEYYPEDLRLKKIVARCMAIAQTGQYNLMRCRKRMDYVTMRTVLARFHSEVIGLVFLLNRKYRPYYKWEFRRMTELPVLGWDVGQALSFLANHTSLSEKDLDEQLQVVLQLCATLATELRKEGLSDSDDWFLAEHAASIQFRIQDPKLRELPLQFE